MIEEFVVNVYSNFGSYFKGKKKTRPLYISLIVLFILIQCVSYSFKIIVDKETLYWVFSSLIQSLASIVAIFGSFSMFRLSKDKKDYDLVSHTAVSDLTQKFIVYTFSIFLLSLIFLMLTPLISSYYLGIPSLYLLFVLTSRSVFLFAKIIRNFLAS